MAGRVVVVGSINTDLVVAADRLPVPGETVLGGVFAEHQGGKGANQAVAAARIGASVSLVGAVGEDRYGELALEALIGEGVDVTRVRRLPERTGVAVVTVGPRGENQIVVAPGANMALTPDMIGAFDGEVLLTDFEVPMEVVIAALRAARDAGMIAVLNPAPAHALPADVLALGPVLTPNEHELTVAIGNDDPTSALGELVRRTDGPVIVTQGAAGALLAHGTRREQFPGYTPPVLADTTGAGDAFAGALAAWMARGASLDEAIDAANAAAALSVATPGARSGMAGREAIEELRAQRPAALEHAARP